MIGFLKIITEEGRRAWVRADEIGTFYETNVHIRAAAGRKPANYVPPPPVGVIALCLRNSNKLLAKNESIESILNKMQQALGTQLHLVERAVIEPGATVTIPAEDEAA